MTHPAGLRPASSAKRGPKPHGGRREPNTDVSPRPAVHPPRALQCVGLQGEGSIPFTRSMTHPAGLRPASSAKGGPKPHGGRRDCATMPPVNPTNDFEDLSGTGLDAPDEAELLRLQPECTFAWVNRSGEPFAVTMAYVERDGRFWLTCVEQRKRVAAVRRNPAVALTISSAGTPIRPKRTISYKGRCIVRSDQETKNWLYPAIATRLRPTDAQAASAFAEALDTPNRVILEVEPTYRLGFDYRKHMARRADAIARDERDAFSVE